MSIQQDWRDPESQKRGMSSGSKLLLVLGGIGGFCLLLCCGGAVYLFVKAKDAIGNFATNDPEAIKANTQEIATIQVLPDFKPVQSLNMFGAMKWVVYQGEAGEGSMLMIMEFNNTMIQGGNKKQQQDQMLDQMRAQHGGGGDVQAEETQTREFTIGGRKNEFTFVKGTQNGKVVRQVTGSFPTSKGVAMLMLIVPEEKYDEAAVVRMLESIRVPVTASEEDEEMEENAETENSEAAGSTITPEQPDQSGTTKPEENGESDADKADDDPNS